MNNSATGPNRVGYRVIKAVRDTRPGAEVLGEVVAALQEWCTPDRWRDMRVVLILKLCCDLTQTKNWQPLNLINCVGKLGEKVVADMIQDKCVAVLNHQHYGSVCGGSDVDILYKSVVEARECLKPWAQWDRPPAT